MSNFLKVLKESVDMLESDKPDVKKQIKDLEKKFDDLEKQKSAIQTKFLGMMDDARWKIKNQEISQEEYGKLVDKALEARKDADSLKNELSKVTDELGNLRKKEGSVSESINEESRSFPEIEKFDSLGRVLTVGEHKKLTQAVLKAVHEVTGGTAIYDQYEKAFEDLKSKYPVLRSFSSKQIDDLWESFMSLDESQEQVENDNNENTSISVGNRVTYSDENGSLSVGKVEKVDGEFSIVNSGGRREKVKTSELELMSNKEYADWKGMHWSNLQAASKMESLQTEDIDTEEIQGDKQKEIIQVMATAIAVGLAQVENILGENFENASQAEKFYWALTRAMRTGSAAGDLKSSLRRFDRIGGERVLSTFRRDLAHV